MNAEIVQIGYWDLVYHLDNAEMTPELCHDLINFSFVCLRDFVEEINKRYNCWYTVHAFVARFLNCLKRLVCSHFYSYVFCILIR